MNRHSLKVRFLALFVTVFVCLNGAGAACVAYCRTMEKPQEPAAHCPLKKLSNHCDKSDAASVDDGDLDCCPMTVSFFAGPLEKPSFSLKQPAPAAEIAAERFTPHFYSFRPLREAIRYRGPPALDRRTERIRLRVLLI